MVTKVQVVMQTHGMCSMQLLLAWRAGALAGIAGRVRERKTQGMLEMSQVPQIKIGELGAIRRRQLLRRRQLCVWLLRGV